MHRVLLNGRAKESGVFPKHERNTDTKSRLAFERGGRCFSWLPPPLPGLVPVTWWHTSPLANMPRRRDKVPRRRHYIAPSPPAPIISLRLACADADRCESERPCDSCSRGDPLQFHRELLYQLTAPPPPRKAACCTPAKTARRSRLFRDVYIVPPAAFVSHYRSAATVFACAGSLFG